MSERNEESNDAYDRVVRDVDLLRRENDRLSAIQRKRDDTLDARIELACRAGYDLIVSEGPPPVDNLTWDDMTRSTDPEDIEAMRMLRQMARVMLEAAG